MAKRTIFATEMPVLRENHGLFFIEVADHADVCLTPNMLAQFAELARRALAEWEAQQHDPVPIKGKGER